MNYWFLLLSCSILCACQRAPPSAPLEGRWQFQRFEQVIYSPTGEILEKITQRPPRAAERSLAITAHELVSHCVQTDPSYPGDSTYLVTRAYTRRGDTLFVVPAPGLEAGPVLIKQLTDKQLVLYSVPMSTPGGPHYEWTEYFHK